MPYPQWKLDAIDTQHSVSPVLIVHWQTAVVHLLVFKNLCHCLPLDHFPLISPRRLIFIRVYPRDSECSSTIPVYRGYSYNPQAGGLEAYHFAWNLTMVWVLLTHSGNNGKKYWTWELPKKSQKANKSWCCLCSPIGNAFKCGWNILLVSFLFHSSALFLFPASLEPLFVFVSMKCFLFFCVSTSLGSQFD